jgi:hypothetical protein
MLLLLLLLLHAKLLTLRFGGKTSDHSIGVTHEILGEMRMLRATAGWSRCELRLAVCE